jgi:HPr kinase/phosphorylase
MTREKAERPSVTVGEFVAGAPAQLQLRIIAGEAGAGTRRLDAARIQKLGLALAGFTHYVHLGRIQLIGQSEVQFLAQLSPERRRAAVGNLELEKISCVLITKGLLPPAELAEVAEAAALPIVQSSLVTSAAIAVVTEYLQEVLAPRERRHGVLLEIHGLGVLIEGESGIGKSECALDLLMRGHRLVADDVVELWRAGPGALRGSAPELLREHMEIRGLGILNVRELFGVTALSGPVGVGLSIRLERWHDTKDVERLGLDAETVEILGTEVPRVLIPVSPGRNLSTLVEAAVRVHLLRLRGYNAAREFVARHSETLGGGGEGPGGGGGGTESPI